MKIRSQEISKNISQRFFFEQNLENQFQNNKETWKSTEKKEKATHVDRQLVVIDRSSHL